MKILEHTTSTILLAAALLLAGTINANAADCPGAYKGTNKNTGKLYFLVEMDHVKSGVTPTREQGRAFIEQGVFPTLALAEKYVSEGKILAGGPVAGRIALRFIVQADSPQEVDRLVESFPLWIVAETRVTPLIAFSDRRANVQIRLEQLVTPIDNPPMGNKRLPKSMGRRQLWKAWI